jgi:hypothetical protein
MAIDCSGGSKLRKTFESKISVVPGVPTASRDIEQMVTTWTTPLPFAEREGNEALSWKPRSPYLLDDPGRSTNARSLASRAAGTTSYAVAVGQDCYDCAWLSLTALSTVTCNLWL